MFDFIIGFLITISLLLMIFICIVIVRAVLFVPGNKVSSKMNHKEQCDVHSMILLNKEKIIDDMSAMLKCKTVSYRDESLMDMKEFTKFQTLLQERFPEIHKKAKLVKIGKTGLLYHIKGKMSDAPTVCMSHYDVVPADETQWEKPAFEGIIENDEIWGRGAIDTKSTLCGVTEALEIMLKNGYVPSNDLYLSFSGEEEIDGSSCPEIVAYLEKAGVKPAFVLDEGGAIVDHVFPGVSKECAIIGTGEKGSVNYELEVMSGGGHSSIPPKHTAAGEISRAVCRIENKPFKRQLTKPVLEMFDTLGRHSTFAYKIIFANLWCFAPLLDILARKSGGELNSMLRTTAAVTKLEGSNAYNVLPPKASCGINVRLMGKDTVDSALNHFNKVVKNSKIKAKVISGTNPSIYSETNCKQWEMLEEVIKETWQDVIVTPYMMPARSDSGHYCKISNYVYRFSAMKLSPKERAMTHGHNERISTDNLLKVVEFYIRLLERV